MAKQIIWSLLAQKDRTEILHYWRIRNQSISYPEKLNLLFKKAIRLLAAHPHIGRSTEIQNIRVKLVRDYLIIYKETETHIEILTIWDNRRNPDELESRFK